MYVNFKIKVSYLIVGVVLLSTMLLAGIVLAGDPDSTGEPSATESYSLEDLYTRLVTGTVGTSSVFTEPTTAPGTGTMHSINDIMDIAPITKTNGATTTQVISGTTFWGLTSGQWGVQTGTLTVSSGGSTYNAAVPKTGITVTYTISDDGALEKGVAWPEPRFIKGTTGVVTDTLTGFIWLTNANCTDEVGGQNPANNSDKLTWTQALTWSNNLADGDCGLSDGSVEGDWRLPNVRELQSLVHYGFFSPAVPNTAGTGQWSAGTPFYDVQSGDYWSSSTFANKPTDAWFVYMHSGYVGIDDESGSYYVWPVRGGQ